MRNLLFALGFALLLVGCASKNVEPQTQHPNKVTQKFSEAIVIRELADNRYLIRIDSKEFDAISYEKFKPGDRVIAKQAGESTIYIRAVSLKGGKTLLITPSKTETISL
ncbi:MAG: hypothetical protein GXZ15_06105 [Campylobacter sp.]|nr:hypothetical protein [Campylobacter sp.]